MKAYQRALYLINPISQIGFFVTRSQDVMKDWSKRADKLTLLSRIETEEDSEVKEDQLSSLRPQQDIPRASFFRYHPH